LREPVFIVVVVAACRALFKHPTNLTISLYCATFSPLAKRQRHYSGIQKLPYCHQTFAVTKPHLLLRYYYNTSTQTFAVALPVLIVTKENALHKGTRILLVTCARRWSCIELVHVRLLLLHSVLSRKKIWIGSGYAFKTGNWIARKKCNVLFLDSTAE
jgi:hypothetical protein